MGAEFCKRNTKYEIEEIDFIIIIITITLNRN